MQGKLCLSRVANHIAWFDQQHRGWWLLLISSEWSRIKMQRSCIITKKSPPWCFVKAAWNAVPSRKPTEVEVGYARLPYWCNILWPWRPHVKLLVPTFTGPSQTVHVYRHWNTWLHSAVFSLFIFFFVCSVHCFVFVQCSLIIYAPKGSQGNEFLKTVCNSQHVHFPWLLSSNDCWIMCLTEQIFITLVSFHFVSFDALFVYLKDSCFFLVVPMCTEKNYFMIQVAFFSSFFLI